MEEDVNVKFDGYDEDLNDNPFFKYIQTRHKTLYDDIAKHRWIVCVPRKGTLSRTNHTLNDVENHFLEAGEEEGSHSYRTLNGKSVKVNEGFIFTEKGFEDVKYVRILFEETFFNDNNESYQVLCLDQPLEGEIGVSAAPVVQVIDHLQGCIDFLWPSTGTKQGQKQIDEIIRLFNSTYQQLEGESLRHLMDAANAIYTRAMQAALKNSQLRKLSQSNKSYMDNLKLAIETYVMHGLYHQLMKGLSCIVGNEDAALNKITRNLAEIQIRDLGIKPEICTNLPRGRRMLSFLNRYTSPLEKFHCLKKSITLITERKMNDKQPGVINAITADDLIPALVFLVIKADIPNWLANITFLHNFHFSKCGYNEFQFYLSSLEAAVEHVRSGHVSSEFKGGAPFKRLQIGDAGSYSLWQPVDHDGTKPTALDMLFEYTAQGNEEEVEKLLSNKKKDGTRLGKMCHPLCSCDKCEKLLSKRRNDPSAVTVFSRDDMGRTVLHVAAEYGHANLTYSMIQKGAVVNTMDYHGSTPLHLACLRGHSKVVLMLLHYKADINAADNDGNTPMHLCVGNGHDQCCKSLVYSDMNLRVLNINVANENGDTPLHLATRWGYVDLVDLLIERGASIEAHNRNNQTPLDCALSQQVSEIILDAAAAHIEKETGFLAFLPDKENKHASKSLRVPVKGSIKSSLAGSPASSLERQSTMKEVDVFLRTVADGDIEMVCFRLSLDEEDEEDPSDMQCKSEQDLCHPLCQCNKCIKWQKLTQRSVDHNVHVNCSNEDGVTPLHVAAVRGYTAIANLLLRHGADANAKDTNKQHTPLHLACQYNHPQVTELLINYSGKIDARDHRGNTPLHFCCLNGHMAPALVLLEHNVNVNVQNDRGNTPLHEAARWNFCELVRVLLQRGACTDIRNKMQSTPIQYATHNDVVKVLEQSEKIANEFSLTRRNTWAGLPSIHSGQKSDISLPNPVESLVGTPLSPNYPQTSSVRVSYSAATKTVEMEQRPRPRSLTESRICDTTIEQPKTKLNSVFEQLEGFEVEKLQEIVKEVRAFDRRRTLKRTVTNDKSVPFFPLKIDRETLEEFKQDELHNDVLFEQRLLPANKPSDEQEEQALPSSGQLLQRVRNVLLDNPASLQPPTGLLQKTARIASTAYYGGNTDTTTNNKKSSFEGSYHGAVLESAHPELESIVKEEITAMYQAAPSENDSKHDLETEQISTDSLQSEVGNSLLERTSSKGKTMSACSIIVGKLEDAKKPNENFNEDDNESGPKNEDINSREGVDLDENIANKCISDNCSLDSGGNSSETPGVMHIETQEPSLQPCIAETCKIEHDVQDYGEETSDCISKLVSSSCVEPKASKDKQFLDSQEDNVGNDITSRQETCEVEHDIPEDGKDTSDTDERISQADSASCVEPKATDCIDNKFLDSQEEIVDDDISSRQEFCEIEHITEDGKETSENCISQADSASCVEPKAPASIDNLTSQEDNIDNNNSLRQDIPTESQNPQDIDYHRDEQ